jgi:hypothetical protein
MNVPYPCVWAVPKVTIRVVPFLVDLHHAKLAVRTPRPQHWSLGCVASNFTHRSKVTLPFQWEIVFEIWILLSNNSGPKPCSSPLQEVIVEWCEMAMEWRVVYVGRRRRLGDEPFDPWEGKRNRDSDKTHPTTRELLCCGAFDPWGET